MVYRYDPEELPSSVSGPQLLHMEGDGLELGPQRVFLTLTFSDFT